MDNHSNSTTPHSIAVVVGGGPIGLAASLNLGLLGFDVSLFDANSDPLKQKIQHNNSEQEFNGDELVILGKRGINSLTEIGFDFTKFFGESNRIKQMGSLHLDKIELSEEQTSEFLYGVPKSELTKKLLSFIRLTQVHVKQYYNYKLQSVDVHLRSLVFNSNEGQSHIACYDLLVAADGTDSFVRKHLIQQVGSFRAVVEYQSMYRYKLFGPLTALQNHVLANQDDGKKGRILLQAQSESNRNSKLTLWSNADGTWCGMLCFPHYALGRDESAQEIVQLISQEYANIFTTKWIQQLAFQASQNKSVSFGRLIRCNQLHGPHAILLGRAAHDLTPVTQQNANAGLEDCKVMRQALKFWNNNPEEAAKTYTQMRVQDVHALQKIENIFYAAKHQSDDHSLLQKLFARIQMIPVKFTQYLASKLRWLRILDVTSLLNNSNVQYSHVLKYIKILAFALIAGCSAGIIYAIKLLIRFKKMQLIS